VQFGFVARAAAVPLPGDFMGGAGTLAVAVDAGAVALSVHNNAEETCPCRGTHGITRTDTLSNITLGGLVIATTAQATAYADKTVSTAETLETSRIENLNLFGGLITAKLLKAAAEVSATTDTLKTSQNGTRLVELVIAGNKIDSHIPDNTIVPLPGIGTVTIKATEREETKNKAHFGINLLEVKVTTANSLGLPVGAKLVLVHANAGYDRVAPPVDLSGAAFGTRIKVDAGTVLQDTTGIGAGVTLPQCVGTNGRTLTKSVADVNVPGVVTVGLEKETATGGPDNGAYVARTTSKFTNVSLLGGLVTADALNAVAQASRTGDTTTTSTTGSGINNLSIAGIPISLTTAPNATLPIPGVGYLVANEQKSGKTSVSVNALHLYVTIANSLGLPVGAQIILSHANAGASKL
jgi:hypothetical protein